MIFYLASIDEQHGEFECEQMFLMALRPDTDPNEALAEFAKDWYGLDATDDDSVGLPEGMYWNDGMAYGAGRVSPISGGTFEELRHTTMMQVLIDEHDKEVDHGEG